MPDFSLGLAIVLLLVLGAEFVNGWTDAPNAIATVVSTRCLSPFQAVCMASMLNLAGVLSGTAVAETIGKDIIDPSAVDLLTVGGAMVGIILWSTLAAGWHSNQRVACFGCRLDWRWVRLGWTAGSGLGRMGKGPARRLLLSSVLGFLAGGLAMTLVYSLFRRTQPARIRGTFRVLQIFSSAFMAFSHGSNDGQKFMGTFTWLWSSVAR